MNFQQSNTNGIFLLRFCLNIRWCSIIGWYYRSSISLWINRSRLTKNTLINLLNGKSKKKIIGKTLQLPIFSQMILETLSKERTTKVIQSNIQYTEVTQALNLGLPSSAPSARCLNTRTTKQPTEVHKITSKEKLSQHFLLTTVPYMRWNCMQCQSAMECQFPHICSQNCYEGRCLWLVVHKYISW